MTPKGEGETSTRKRKRYEDDRRLLGPAPPLELTRVKDDGTKLELMFTRAHSLVNCRRGRSSFSLEEESENFE